MNAVRAHGGYLIALTLVLTLILRKTVKNTILGQYVAE